MSDIFISWCDTLFEGCMTISVSKNVIVYVRRRSYFFPFLNWKIREKLQFLPEGKNLPIWSSWTYSTCIIHFLLFFFNKRMMAYMGKHFLKGFDRPHKRWGCAKRQNGGGQCRVGDFKWRVRYKWKGELFLRSFFLNNDQWEGVT